MKLLSSHVILPIFAATSCAFIVSCTASHSGKESAPSSPVQGLDRNIHSFVLEAPQSGKATSLVTRDDVSPRELSELHANAVFKQWSLSRGVKRAKPPRMISSKPPIYPRDLVDANINGKVTVDMLIDDKGNVVYGAIRSSTDRRFNETTLRSVSSMKFSPSEDRQGHPLCSVATMPFVFELVTASVTAVLTVEEDGHVSDVKIEKSTHPLLNEAVIRELKKGRMQPLAKGSGPHKGRLKITFR